jgi:GNAT superfamily N-acetyltransferase
VSYRFNFDYHEEVQLRNHEGIHLRLLRAEDRPLLSEAFHRFSPESRRLRFHVTKNELTESDLDRLTQTDLENHVAIGAYRLIETDQGQQRQGIGVGRFFRDPNQPLAADWAIAVVDEFHGQGLGTLLLDRLWKAASERGLVLLRSNSFTDNMSVLKLMERLPRGLVRLDGDGEIEIRHLLTADLPKVFEEELKGFRAWKP